MDNRKRKIARVHCLATTQPRPKLIYNCLPIHSQHPPPPPQTHRNISLHPNTSRTGYLYHYSFIQNFFNTIFHINSFTDQTDIIFQQLDVSTSTHFLSTRYTLGRHRSTFRTNKNKNRGKFQFYNSSNITF